MFKWLDLNIKFFRRQLIAILVKINLRKIVRDDFRMGFNLRLGWNVESFIYKLKFLVFQF